MPDSFDASAQQIDLLIQKGEGAQAQKQIENIFKKPIARKDAATAAALAWRVGLPHLGIRALNPLVRPSSRRPEQASAEEKMEYAGCLVRIGATEEAMVLLDSINAPQLPRLLLIKAFAHISEWNYKTALSYLSKYVRTPGLRPYDRIVGKVNLAEALIHEKTYDKALLALRDLLHESSLRRLTLVYGKVLELSAHYWIELKGFKEANKHLRMAEKLLQKTNGIDIFFVKKWTAFSAFTQSGGKPGSQTLLSDVRKEAQSLEHWETVRDCDRLSAVVTKNDLLLKHLFFGTPYEAFRSRYLKEMATPADCGTEYIWQLGLKASAQIDLNLADRSSDLKGSLPAGGLLHRLLLTLSSDFYRPFRVATLFSRLYPGQFYSPTSSPHRVHESVNRLRDWIAKEKLGLVLEETGGGYQLTSTKPLAICVPLRDLAPSKKTNFLTLVRKKWPNKSFSVTEISKAMNCSPRSALTYAKTALEEGQLSKEGKGPTTRYRLAS